MDAIGLVEEKDGSDERLKKKGVGKKTVSEEMVEEIKGWERKIGARKEGGRRNRGWERKMGPMIK